MTAPQRFEDRLQQALHQVVADRPAPAAAPRRHRRPGRLVLLVGGVAAASAAVAVVAATGDRTPSAYAVQSQPGGAVTVSIRSLRDADGLERSLRAVGVPAVVDYVADATAGCIDRDPGPESGTSTGGGSAGPTFHRESGAGTGPSLSGPGPGAHGMVTSQVSVGPDGATFTIDPGQLQPGDTVYITTSTGAVSSIGMAIAREQPPAICPPAS